MHDYQKKKKKKRGVGEGQILETSKVYLQNETKTGKTNVCFTANKALLLVSQAEDVKSWDEPATQSKKHWWLLADGGGIELRCPATSRISGDGCFA